MDSFLVTKCDKVYCFSFKGLQYVLHSCSDLKVLMAAVERLPLQKNMDLSATLTCFTVTKAVINSLDIINHKLFLRFHICEMHKGLSLQIQLLIASMQILPVLFMYLVKVPSRNISRVTNSSLSEEK